jgi:predicted ATPase/class 3 adenylate cyclase
MRCPSCQRENDGNSRFCTACGVALHLACPRCASLADVEARFCSKCGTALVAQDSANSSLESERRQITVLFADIAGSTSLIEALDAEDAAKRLTPAIDAMRQAVARFEGSVVKVQGDGIMALFGAPNPHEDHAVRACCAALAMQVGVAALGDADLKARVGLHTGEVVTHSVTTDISKEYDATGLTVHIASRMEQSAGSGNILMTGETYRGARNFIDAQALGPQPVKGLSQPVEVWRLIGLKRGPASQRFRGERSLSDFVGRAREMQVLAEALEDTEGGEPRLVGVVGDAGIGKSRLCFEFAEFARRRGVRVLEARALAHSNSTPFEPVVDLLCDYFRIVGDEPPIAREKVAVRLRFRDGSDETDVALMCDFLGLGGEPPKIDATVRRERLLQIVCRLLRAGARETTLVILIEDLHWIDSGSAAFLEAVAEAVLGTKALLLFNFRPGYTASWMGYSYYQQLALRPLRQGATDGLLNSLIGTDPALELLVRRIAERAQGNPFFIEEQVRALEERGVLTGKPGNFRLAAEPPQDFLPPTVQAIVAARIDRRPDLERSVLHAAAVVGREFSIGLLSRISDLPANVLRPVLQRLCAAELAYETGAADEGTYAFKHPLTQEVAYRSQLTDRRRAVHAKIAGELEKTLPDAQTAQASFIAWHWEEADNAPQAVQWNAKAAAWFGTRDPAQAFDSWKRVYRLIKRGPLEGPARYMLMMAAGQLINLAWRVGVTAAEAQSWFDEAMDLAQAAGDTRAITLITAAYGRLLGATGSAEDYVAKVGEALKLLQLPRDRSLEVTLTAILSHALRLAGRLEEALEANDRALSGIEEISELDQQTLGFDIGVWVKGGRAQTLASLRRFDEARALADQLLDPANTNIDTLHRMLGHVVHIDCQWIAKSTSDATRHASQMQAMAEKSGNPYLLVYAEAYRGLAQALEGDPATASGTLRSALNMAKRKKAGLELAPRLERELRSLQAMS